jgi:hypothetical protein
MQSSTHPPVAMPPPTPALLFGLAWTELAAALGTTALAVLMRRALDRAVAETPTLHGFGIEREGLGYRYRLPSTWSEHDAAAEADLTALVRALIPFLAEFTGSVVVQRLTAIEPLWTQGIVHEEHLSGLA